MLNGSISLSDAEIHMIGEAADDQAGKSLTSIGDLDGDNLNELLIGAPQNDSAYSNAGKTYLFYNSSIAQGTISLSEADMSYTGEDTNNFSGASVVAPGDLNNDGTKDLIIGAYGNNINGPNTGKAHIFFNPMD